MVSAALARWRSERSSRIDELLQAHKAVGGPGPGRRVGTAQLNWSLVLRLAGEFQGFARELHDNAVDHLVNTLAPNQVALASTLRLNFTNSRRLDTGNAQPGSLGADFNRLGFRFWDAIHQRDARGKKWQQSLDALNEARNAIAHVEEYKLTALAAKGYPLRLSTIKTWRSNVSGLARCMDTVVADSLAVMLNSKPPW